MDNNNINTPIPTQDDDLPFAKILDRNAAQARRRRRAEEQQERIINTITLALFGCALVCMLWGVGIVASSGLFSTPLCCGVGAALGLLLLWTVCRLVGLWRRGGCDK